MTSMKSGSPESRPSKIKNLHLFKRHGWPRPHFGRRHDAQASKLALLPNQSLLVRPSVGPEEGRKYDKRPSMLHKHLADSLAHTHARFNVRCMWVSLCFRSFWFCLFAFAFSGVLFHKVSGSYVHVCLRPCLSTCRWARLATHRHDGPPT